MLTVAENKISQNALDSVVLKGVENFDIEKIFDCGQCFRFDKVEGSSHTVEFSGVAFGKLISIAQEDDVIYIYNSTTKDYYNIWEHFLGLDVDYEKINNDILCRSNNPNLIKAMDFGNGIRILSQERWETICSFIISQNNNIPRIKKIIDSLCKKCGEKINVSDKMISHTAPNQSYYTFPSPERILDLGVDGLYDLKTGFRAKYIYDAARKVVDGELDLDSIFNASTDIAAKQLCSVKGIGPKVAACALLFGFEKYDSFPIDVWIKRVIAKYFSDDVNDFDPNILGCFAGIAQQYLFYYERYEVNKK